MVGIMPLYYWLILSLPLRFDFGYVFEQVIFPFAKVHLYITLLFYPHKLFCGFLYFPPVFIDAAHATHADFEVYRSTISHIINI